MQVEAIDELHQFLEQLEAGWETQNLSEFEGVAIATFRCLFELEGGPSPTSYIQRGLTTSDMILELGGVKKALEITRRKVDLPKVKQVLGHLEPAGDPLEVILFSPVGFTQQVRELAKNHAPGLELVDLARIRAWANDLPTTSPPEGELSDVEIAVRRFSNSLAEAVAEQPDALAHLEWRDVERMLAMALEGLGFEVELTPPAKDGGRDIVVQCRILGRETTYFVEVKHWKTRVGPAVVRHFVDVVVDEGVSRGLLLSTGGFTSGAFENLSAIERRVVAGQGAERTVAICQSYVRRNQGLLLPQYELPKLLFGDESTESE